MYTQVVNLNTSRPVNQKKYFYLPPDYPNDPKTRLEINIGDEKYLSPAIAWGPGSSEQIQIPLTLPIEQHTDFNVFEIAGRITSGLTREEISQLVSDYKLFHKFYTYQKLFGSQPQNCERLLLEIVSNDIGSPLSEFANRLLEIRSKSLCIEPNN
ncbi:MAG: hypothetical protein ABIJ59_13865 [Pseudomonadota bacterium]